MNLGCYIIKGEPQMVEKEIEVMSKEELFRALRYPSELSEEEKRAIMHRIVRLEEKELEDKLRK